MSTAGVVLVVSIATAAVAAPAAAVEPAPPPPSPSPRPSALDGLQAGRRLLKTAPTIGTLDGSWSIVLQVSSLLASRRWDAPYPQGLLAQGGIRMLYGGSWMAMLGLAGLAASAATGGSFDWIEEASFRANWMVGLTAPPCPDPRSATGGCGLGLGGHGGLHVRRRGSRLWYEVTGGWIEQRIADDDLRTLSQSVWVLAPLVVTYEIATAAGGPIALRLRAGPGLYFGMRNAHAHPTPAGAEVLDIPWYELRPLDVGVGPGARIEARVVCARRLHLEGELVVAPLLAGTRRTGPPPEPELAPLDADGEARGLPIWRMLAAGVAWDDPRFLPMRIGLSVFAAELSGRSLSRLGHRGVLVRFDFPLAAPGARL
jgi:hypothetical protein